MVSAPREDCQQEYLRLGQLCPELFHHRFDSGSDFRRVAAPGVIGTDHKYGELRPDAGDVSVVQPPQDVLRLVAADSQVDGIAFLVVLLPHFLAPAFPSVRDRITDQQQIDVPFLHPFIHRLMPGLPPSVVPRDRFGTGKLLGIFRQRPAAEQAKRKGQ